MNIPERGPFSFGAPYTTMGIRLTNEEDGDILPRTYSYYPNINAHLGRDTMKVFLGTSKGPCWWEIDKCSYEVSPGGPIFPDHFLSTSTAEGWYWDWKDPEILYCTDDKHLYRYHFDTNDLETVVDITPLMWIGDFALRQWHTGRFRHSATVKQMIPDGAWPNIGTVVYDEDTCQPWTYFPKGIGKLDESQIDRRGYYLLIKENLDGQDDEDNRIIELDGGAERIIMDREGAGGHSDSGYGYFVHADNWQTNATWRITHFDQSVEPQGVVVYETPWDKQMIHVSHCNAKPQHSATQEVLGSGTIDDLIMVPLDGTMISRVVAPSMCTYPTSDPYDYLPKANLDPHGKMALWTRFDGNRFEAFIVKL